MNINNYFKRSKVLFQRGVSILLMMSVINKNDDGLTKSDDAVACSMAVYDGAWRDDEVSLWFTRTVTIQVIYLNFTFVRVCENLDRAACNEANE